MDSKSGEMVYCMLYCFHKFPIFAIFASPKNHDNTKNTKVELLMKINISYGKFAKLDCENKILKLLMIDAVY